MLTGKPEQQRFTMQSGALTSIRSRQRSEISGRPLPERTDFGSLVPSQPHYDVVGGRLVEEDSKVCCAWMAIYACFPESRTMHIAYAPTRRVARGGGDMGECPPLVMD